MISCLPPSPPQKGKIFLSQSLWFNDSKFLPWGISFSIWKSLKVVWSQVWWQRQLRPRKEPSSRCPGSGVLGSCIYFWLESPWAPPWMPCGGLPGDVVFVKLSNHFPREKLADTGVSASQLLVGSLCQWGHCGGLLCHQLLVSLLLPQIVLFHPPSPPASFKDWQHIQVVKDDTSQNLLITDANYVPTLISVYRYSSIFWAKKPVELKEPLSSLQYFLNI